MRKAFTFFELMIVIAIIAIIVAIAIPNLQNARSIKPGSSAKWNGQIVNVVAYDMKTEPITFIIRLPDNKEIRVPRNELTPLAERN